MEREPTVSAVVDMQPGAEASVPKTKSALGAQGFEVHAPMGMSFSIAATRSTFEKVFGVKLAVDEEALMQVVTTEDGSLELPLSGVPEEVRDAVARVRFMPGPDLPS